MTDMMGPLIDRQDIETAAVAHIETWINFYLAWVERKHGLQPRDIPTLQTIARVSEFTRFPEDILPAALVISPGVNPSKPITEDGEGNLSAWWVIAMGIVVSAADSDAARDLAGYYAAAVRALMVQNPTLNDIAMGTVYEDENYTDIGREEGRQVGAARLVFSVQIDSVMNVYGGTAQEAPPDDPYAPPGDYPIVGAGQATVDVELEDR